MLSSVGDIWAVNVKDGVMNKQNTTLEQDNLSMKERITTLEFQLYAAMKEVDRLNKHANFMIGGSSYNELTHFEKLDRCVGILQDNLTELEVNNCLLGKDVSSHEERALNYLIGNNKWFWVDK